MWPQICNILVILNLYFLANVMEQKVESGKGCTLASHTSPCCSALPPGVVAQALTAGAVEAGGAGVPAVGGEVLRAVIASRAGEAGCLAAQVAVGASRARMGKAGPAGAEVALGTGPPAPRVA